MQFIRKIGLSLYLLIVVLLQPTVALAMDKPVILVWGDSLSAAYGIPVEKGWVALLQERLGDGFKVINGSISGETTAGGLTRLPAALKDHQPAFLVLELGANDGLRGQPPKQMQANLQQMIELSQAAGAKVILLGILMPENYGSAYTQRFAKVYSDLADQYKLPFVPFLLEGVALKDELLLPDGLHPNAVAQPIVLEHLWPTLEPVFLDKATETPLTSTMTQPE